MCLRKKKKFSILCMKNEITVCKVTNIKVYLEYILLCCLCQHQRRQTSRGRISQFPEIRIGRSTQLVRFQSNSQELYETLQSKQHQQELIPLVELICIEEPAVYIGKSYIMYLQINATTIVAFVPCHIQRKNIIIVNYF